MGERAFIQIGGNHYRRQDEHPERLENFESYNGYPQIKKIVDDNTLSTMIEARDVEQWQIGKNVSPHVIPVRVGLSEVVELKI